MEEIFIFQATVLKFGNLLGMELGSKCKITAQYLQISPARPKKHRNMG